MNRASATKRYRLRREYRSTPSNLSAKETREKMQNRSVFSAERNLKLRRINGKRNFAPTNADTRGGRETGTNAVHGLRTDMSAHSAAKSFIPTEQTADTAAYPAILLRGGTAMTDELRESITAYRTVMSVVKEMLRAGIISDREYAEIDTMLTEKYGLNSCTIFR